MTKESAPYGIAAAALFVVGGAAALSAVFAAGANAESYVAVASGADAGVGLAASTHTPPAEREDSGGTSPTAIASASASAIANPGPSANRDAKPAPSSSAKPAASSQQAEASGQGFLTIITTPSAKLSAHGRVLCTATPCSKLAFSAGQHVLTLENKEDLSKTTVTVTITSGETTVKRVKLKTAATAP